jgi:hypothetical protein
MAQRRSTDTDFLPGATETLVASNGQEINEIGKIGTTGLHWMPQWGDGRESFAVRRLRA